MLRAQESRHGDDGQRLLRDFTLASAFSLAFAFISPIVALYAIFPLGIEQVGRGFWLAFPIALVGQMLVAAVFAMLVSRYPIEGSIYQWSRLLIGPRYGWFAGWAYIWGLTTTIATVAIGAAGFLLSLFDLPSQGGVAVTAIAIALIVLATLGNTLGRALLKRAVALCITAEMIGSLGVGTLLWFSARHPVANVALALAPSGAGHSLTAFFNTPIAIAVALCGWAFLGFESAGAIAEEVKDPQRSAPRAILLSLLCVGAIVTFAAASLAAGLPPQGAPQALLAADPVGSILIYHFGRAAYKAILLVFLTAFMACMLGIQATVSRVVWAYARDAELPFAEPLRRLSGHDRLPVNSIATIGVGAALFCFLGLTNLYGTILAFATAGFYLGFAFPLLAAAWTHARGRWQRTPYHFGIFAAPIIYLAAAWTVFETVNISWPRAPTTPWYVNYAVPLTAFLLALLGLLVRRYLSRNAVARVDHFDRG